MRGVEFKTYGYDAHYVHRTRLDEAPLAGIARDLPEGGGDAPARPGVDEV